MLEHSEGEEGFVCYLGVFKEGRFLDVMVFRVFC